MIDECRGSTLSDAEFRIFADLIRQRCGLHFDENTRYIVEKRVARRIQQTDLGSVSAYLYQLRNGPNSEEEFSAIIDILTTNETYFLRERSQLDALVGEAIPEILSRPNRLGEPVRIWSAGCASGEEPFSIVMLAREAGLEPGRDFRVYASDISKTVLAKARRGVYRETSFRETEDRYRSRFFTHKDGLARISDEIKREVDFVHLNLLDESKLALLGSMDVVLCRNVIIYFDLETKKRVVQSFHQKLRPGGYLFLGHAESLIRITSDFELKHLGQDLVYRRPVPGEEREDPWLALKQRALDDPGLERLAAVSVQNRLRVLVIDDSAHSRQTITHMLESSPLVEVIGWASNGEEALRRTLELEPDLITLDLEMPRMDGFTFLRLLMAKRPTPVLVVSSRANGQDVFQALDLGAVDFIAKPSARATPELESIEEALIRKVHAMRHLRIDNLQDRVWRAPRVETPTISESAEGVPVVAIGSSTGGPAALMQIFSALEKVPACAFLVAQHMPVGFTRGFAERLNRMTPFSVQEAAGGETLDPGTVWIAPGGGHLEVEYLDCKLKTRVEANTGNDRFIPSVDRLFSSAAKEIAGELIAVVLTGMGDDGCDGARQVKQAGGRVIAESEETAVIYGMPKRVVQAGFADRVLSLGDIPAAILREIDALRKCGSTLKGRGR